MNFKLTLTLVIVVLLLASAFLLLKDRKPADKTAEASAKPLIDPAPAAVNSISYTRDGKEQVAFARVGETWKMTFPVDAAVESWNVASIGDALKAIGYKDKFEPAATGPKSAEATGTQSPRHVIKFTDGGDKEYTLNLGKRTVGGIFATLNGGKTIYLLADNPLDQLDKDPQEFRAKNIKEIKSDKVTAITLKRSDQTVALSKAGDVDHHWLINAPIASRANGAVVDEILRELKAVNATGFSDMKKDMPATGLNPPRLAVTAYVSESSPTPSTAPATTSAPAAVPVTLELGYYTDLANKKNVYASLAGSSQVFTLSAESFNKLNRELKDLRDPAITPAAVGEATEFSIEPQGKPAIKVAKKDGKWSATSGVVSVPAGDLEVGDILGDIRNLRAIKFLDHAGDLKSIGLEPALTKLELTVPNQSQHEVLLVGNPQTAEKVTPMMRQGEPTVYLVPTGDAEHIVPTLLSLRDKAVERLPSERIRGVTIAGAGADGSAIAMEREGTSWKVQGTGGAKKVDDEKLTGLLADFTPLTAVKFVAENVSVSGNPDVVVTLNVAEAAVAPPPATASAPATVPATAPASMGPQLEKMVTRTLKLYKTTSNNQATWKAVWDGAPPQWTFEPTADLITHVTRTSYAVATTQATTQAATQPATQPGK